MYYNIRLAEKKDLATLPGIEKKASALFKETKYFLAVGKDVTTFEDFEEAQEDGHLFVAINENDKPIGFAYMEIMGHGVHLDELDVLPEYGGKGIGTALVKKVNSWAKEKSYSAVSLTTYKNISWNAPFYKKLGFKEVVVSEMPKQLYTLFLQEHEQGLLMEDRVVMIFEVEK
ncbi:MAG: GNAT family N-acetyltransferase [Calditrichaeota bacterium]|nr:MAG: GNAT family N-acetyltransferase [Calditrichota bacterium]MBL1204782.1 GNAT family N-acetyltransferase [Calditrichota bacterium]NOG44611.1 GNAT family N-acetyltransferase [Calditrichota bacterium]